MVLLGGRSSPPVPPSPKERGASRKGDGGQILTPRSSHTLLFGDFSQGEGANPHPPFPPLPRRGGQAGKAMGAFYYWVIIQ